MLVAAVRQPRHLGLAGQCLPQQGKIYYSGSHRVSCLCVFLCLCVLLCRELLGDDGSLVCAKEVRASLETYIIIAIRCGDRIYVGLVFC